MVGVSEDPIGEYLAQLRAGLHTSPRRAEEIMAEAEDHLRESAAAGLAAGMTERDVHEAAIAAFGPVRAVVRAHRRPAAVLAEVGMVAWKLAAVYLLMVFCAGVALLIFLYWILGLETVVPQGPPPGTRVVQGPADFLRLAVILGIVGITGLALLSGYVAARRYQRRRARARAALLGGYFPMAAAICMLFTGAVVVAMHMVLNVRVGQSSMAALVAAACFVAIGYAVRMVWTLLRQGRSGRPGRGGRANEEMTPYAG